MYLICSIQNAVQLKVKVGALFVEYNACTAEILGIKSGEEKLVLVFKMQGSDSRERKRVIILGARYSRDTDFCDMESAETGIHEQWLGTTA